MNISPTTTIVDVADCIRTYITDRVVLPHHADVIMTLWSIYTHCFDAFEHSPRLIVTSPTRGCAKSVALKTLRVFASGAKIAIEPTPAAVRLSMHKSQGFETYLFDEADRWLAKKTEITTILNSGTDIDLAWFEKCIGEGAAMDVERQYVYCPVAIGAIGLKVFDETLLSRSVVVHMSKANSVQLKSIKAKYNSKVDFTAHAKHREFLSKWGRANKHALEKNIIDPSSLGEGRYQDTWRPLITIANQLSPQWLRAIEDAYTHYMNEAEPDESIQLLIHLKEIFDEYPQATVLPSELICKALHRYNLQPWGSTSFKPLHLAARLKDFKVKSAKLTYNSKRPMCYQRVDMERLFNNYLI